MKSTWKERRAREVGKQEIGKQTQSRLLIVVEKISQKCHNVYSKNIKRNIMDNEVLIENVESVILLSLILGAVVEKEKEKKKRI